MLDSETGRGARLGSGDEPGGRDGSKGESGHRARPGEGRWGLRWDRSSVRGYGYIQVLKVS